MTRALNDAARVDAIMRGRRPARFRSAEQAQPNILAMFRQGCDSCAIARIINITEPEALRRLHAAREAERGEG